jgi:hypothetical protein
MISQLFRADQRFMAVNETTLATTVEGKTVYSDWIEIHNPTPAPVDLGGWFLTDDPGNRTKWALPAVRINPGGFLVVFASGIEEQNHPENWPYQDQKGSYHTNFALESEGEYLALIAPDLQVAHEYFSQMTAGATGVFRRNEPISPTASTAIRNSTSPPPRPAGPTIPATPASRPSRSFRDRRAPSQASFCWS